jgi:circadian clock protein KaiB
MSDSNSYKVRLYIAGDAPNSRMAMENLDRLQKQMAAEFHLEIVDVLKDPRAALDEGIFVTPALQVLDPGPGALIFGNLSDNQALSTVFTRKST